MISNLCDELSIALRQITVMVITLPTRRQCWVCHQSNIQSHSAEISHDNEYLVKFCSCQRSDKPAAFVNELRSLKHVSCTFYGLQHCAGAVG